MMLLKKYIKLIIAGVIVGAMTASLAACAGGEAPAETTEAAAKETVKETQEAVGMPNPMVEITDSSEFEKQLGIRIDASKFHTTPKMYIINGKVADVILEETNVDGEPVEYRLRATKDAELAPSMHGIYEELTDIGQVDLTFGDVKVTIDKKENRDKKLDVDTWQVGDTYYSLVINNTHSQMQYAEVMDSIFAAIGVDTTAEEEAQDAADAGDMQDAGDEEEEVTYIPDGTTRVGIQNGAVTNKDGGKELVECEIYTLVVMDESDVKALKRGGAISLARYGLPDIPIDSIERKSNGAIEVDDAIMIEKDDEQGGYTLRGYDDDMVKYVSDVCMVEVNRATKIDDQMSEIAGEDGPCISLTEALDRYGFFEATIESKDGIAAKVTIHYHP